MPAPRALCSAGSWAQAWECHLHLHICQPLIKAPASPVLLCALCCHREKTWGWKELGLGADDQGLGPDPSTSVTNGFLQEDRSPLTSPLKNGLMGSGITCPFPVPESPCANPGITHTRYSDV